MLSLDIGASGMLAQQLNVDVISNNIANMTTNGYKRQRAEFYDLMYQNRTRPGATSSDVGTIVPSGLQVGLGVRPGSVYRIHEQGAMISTTNPLDIAISGQGYLQIQMPDGTTGYTRNGTLQVNEQGQLVTTQGYLVEPNITVPEDATNVEINESGEVLVSIQGQVALQNLGQMQLARFINDAGLEAIGNNLLLETEASGSPIVGNPNEDGYGRILQGFLESSNVDVVNEITSLIRAQRAYEMSSNVVSTSDEMMNTASQLR